VRIGYIKLIPMAPPETAAFACIIVELWYSYAFTLWFLSDLVSWATSGVEIELSGQSGALSSCLLERGTQAAGDLWVLTR
jgi:hypothetical protein